MRGNPTVLRDKLLWMILLPSLALKLALAVELDNTPPTNDEADYLYAAKILVEQGRYGGTFRPPLYPACIALNLAAGWGTLGVRLTQVVLSTFTIFLVYRIARRTFGLTAARVAAALVAFDPTLVAFSHLLWSETLFIFLLFVALDLIIASVSARRYWLWLTAGLVFGLAGLTRPMILTFLPLLWLWAVLQLHRQRASHVEVDRAASRSPWLSGSVQFGVLILGCALVVSPWTIRNARLTGAFILVDSNSPYNVLLGTRPEAAFVAKDDWRNPQFGDLGGQHYRQAVRQDARQAQRLALETAWENIRANPGLYLRKCLWEAGHLWTLDSFLLRHLRNDWYGPHQPGWLTPTLTVISVAYFVVLVLAGLVGLTAQAPSAFHGLAILILLHSTVLYGLTLALSRHFLPLHPVLAIAAAALLATPRTTLGRLWSAGWRSPRVYVLVLLLLGLGLVWAGDWKLVADMVRTGGVHHRFHFDLFAPVN